WTVIPPGKGRINDHGQRGIRRIIARIVGQIGRWMASTIAKQFLSPAHITAKRLGIGVEHNLAGVEALPLLGCVGTIDAIAIELTWEHLWEVGVPDLISLGWHDDAVGFLVGLHGVKEAQLHLGNQWC